MSKEISLVTENNLSGPCSPFGPPLPPGPRPCVPDFAPKICGPTCNPACAPACMPSGLPRCLPIVDRPPPPKPPIPS